MSIDQALKDGKKLVSKFRNAELTSDEINEKTIYIIEELVRYIENILEDDMK